MPHAALGSPNYAIVINGADFSSSPYGMVTWSGSSDTVIGGYEYSTCTIGSQTWLTKNLDLKWDGTAAHYPDNDEVAHGFNGDGQGLIYTTVDMNYMLANASSLFPWWHIPTKELVKV